MSKFVTQVRKSFNNRQKIDINWYTINRMSLEEHYEIDKEWEESNQYLFQHNV